MTFDPDDPTMLLPRHLSPARALASVLACMVLAHGVARAEQPHRGRGFHVAQADERAMRRSERMQQRSMMRESRQQAVQQRAEREAPPAIVPAPAPQGPAGRPGRMTPDERRALRQQIDEAGRDVYRPGRPP